jgi:hypothetical protein
MPVLTKDRDAFLRAIGAAVQSYAEVEASQSRLLQCLIDVDSMQATTVFFTVQNVRSRNEMFGSLLEHKYKDTYKKYWKSCGAFLYTLAIYRNAIAHWHPLTIVYVNRGEGQPKDAQAAIHNPMPGRRGALTLESFRPFMMDCAFVRSELDQFSGFLRDPDGRDDPTLPDRFSRPLPRQNLASLQPSPPPKGPAPPHRSSRKK